MKKSLLGCYVFLLLCSQFVQANEMTLSGTSSIYEIAGVHPAIQQSRRDRAVEAAMYALKVKALNACNYPSQQPEFSQRVCHERFGGNRVTKIARGFSSQEVY